MERRPTRPGPPGASHPPAGRTARMGLILARAPSDVVVTLGVAAATAVVLPVVVGFRATSDSPGRIPSGVTISGIAVGGLTPGEAERVVVGAVGRPDGELHLIVPGREGPLLTLPVVRLDPVPRVRRAVLRASRPASLSYRVRRELGLGARREVVLDYRLRSRTVDAIVRRAARAVDRRPRSARLSIARGAIVVRPAANGQAVDRPALRMRLARLPPRLLVPVESIRPPVTDAEAEMARSRASRIAGEPVLVTAGRRSARVGRGALRDALVFRRASGTITVRLDPEVIERELAPAFGAVVRPPRSARFRVRGPRVDIVAARPGRAIDFAANVRAIERRHGDAVRLRTRVDPPRLSTRQARRLRIRELVSEFTTPYVCCQPRVTNIIRAAEILDGQIVGPGAIFSLNEALGQRTTARGFVPAPQINAGRLEDAVGGGVSQIATTVFNAAFFAGLRIVTHTPHEFWISRYPPGREATVSWGGPELIVRNDWPAAVLLKVRATTTGVRVRMYSSRLGRRVVSETQGTARAGVGFSIGYTRRVLAGGVVRRDERYRWSYRAPPPPA